MIQTEENRIIVLCRELLGILEKEQVEIAEHNLDNLEHYGSLKAGLIKEMQLPANSGLWNSNPEHTAEIRSLMEKIVDINGSNEKALLNIKEEIFTGISTIQETKTAHKAYLAGQ